MLQRMRVTPRDLFEQFQRVQEHQTTLPQTICHGDAHIGNTYVGGLGTHHGESFTRAIRI